MNKAKKIEEVYYNSLLKISSQNEDVTQALLEKNGVNTINLVSKTLKNISNYEFALMQTAVGERQHQLLETLMDKIASLLIKAPERAMEIINSFVQPRIPSFRFKSNSYTSDISEIFDMIDPITLIEKLEAIEKEIDL